MASEESPLLSTTEDIGPKSSSSKRPDDHDVYLRFSSSMKSIILVMVSGCGVINCMYIPFQSSEPVPANLFMSRFPGWDFYTFSTTDRQGPRFNRGRCQVSHFSQDLLCQRDLSSIFFLFPV